jgi:primosomal protein N' (replication factor Y)
VPGPISVRVRTEVAALSKTFDYAVPEGWAHDVGIGTRVRAPLHGRSVRGWVVGVDGAAPPGVALLPLKSWLGWGPPPGVVALAEWAAWRWAGPQSFFLRVASPETVARALPRLPHASVHVPKSAGDGASSVAGTAMAGWGEARASAGTTMVRLPPATDLIDLVLSVIDGARPGEPGRPESVLVLVPSSGWAERLAARLRGRGLAVARTWDEARAGWPVVIGSRAAAWAPVPRLAAAVVLDAHDAAYQEESAPTYSAVDVLIERARRDGAPCILVSPVPPVALANSVQTSIVAPAGVAERAGWPAVETVDRRLADPRTGLFSEEFVRLARAALEAGSAADGPVVCVYNRTGGARLLACRACGELARCARCGAVAAHPRGETLLRCPRCDATRPVVCTACGRLRMKTLRVGVSRLREEIAALLGTEVGEVTGVSPEGEDQADPSGPRVLVGTEAVLHRARSAAAVAFLDIDLHLLAPRLSATEETLALLVRAGRVVGARGAKGPWARVLVQTRVPDHPALQAAARGEPARVLEDEVAVRRESGLPPFSALALLSGTRAPEYAEALRHAGGGNDPVAVDVIPLDAERFLVRAGDHDALCDLLARVARPSGRGLRVEVDPQAL